MKACRLYNNTRIQKQYEQSIQEMDHELLSLRLANPALRALVDHKVKRISQLKNYSDADVLTWHGIGPSAIKKLRPYLKVVIFKK